MIHKRNACCRLLLPSKNGKAIVFHSEVSGGVIVCANHGPIERTTPHPTALNLRVAFRLMISKSNPHSLSYCKLSTG